ncbi:MAG TPA: hypothetical protein VJJ98_05745 [Sedimentisphaerales bacterium]|nr:hypothetical protein [Sedimentisphaerales bacterium]
MKIGMVSPDFSLKLNVGFFDQTKCWKPGDKDWGEHVRTTLEEATGVKDCLEALIRKTKHDLKQ